MCGSQQLSRVDRLPYYKNRPSLAAREFVFLAVLTLMRISRKSCREGTVEGGEACNEQVQTRNNHYSVGRRVQKYTALR